MRSAAAALTLGITLTVAGLASCASPDDPVAPPGPDPSVTPVFATEEEALAAAEDLYGRYLQVSDAIALAGWGDTSALESVTKGSALEDERKTAASLHSKGWLQRGSSAFDSLAFQQKTDRGAGTVEATVYLCLDVTNADVVNEDGDSVVSANRPDRQALEVGMDDFDGVLKVNRSEMWTGQNFC